MSRKMISKEGFFVSWRTLKLWFLASPLAVLFFVSFFYLFAYLMSFDLAPQWFQAIGTIGAICAAVWISKQEIDRRRREKLCDAAAYMSGVLSIVDASAKIIRDVIDRTLSSNNCGTLIDTSLKTHHVKALESMLFGKVKTLQRVDITRISSSNFVNGFVCYLSSIELAASLVCNCLEYPISGDLTHLRNWGDQSGAHTLDMRKAFECYIFQNGISSLNES